MLCGAIDIHKNVFQAVVVDPETGEAAEERFPATREQLGRWAQAHLVGRECAVAVEATTGWRWVWRELAALGIEVRLAEPVQARALRGRRRGAKNDRLDARWLALLLAREMLPEAWIPPLEIQQLRDLTRLRQAIAEDRTRWAQRLHAFLTHEGWPCARSRLLTATGRRWVRALALDPPARRQAERMLALIEALDAEIGEVERELRGIAREDARARALQGLYGVGPLIACTLLAEIGVAGRFRRSAQIVRLAGLDPVVEESADTRRRGHLAKAGSPHLRWALVEAAVHASRAAHPDHALHRQVATRADTTRARLSVARKVGRRAFHVLRQAELAQAA
jgi:transposase